jgi:pilus assembly protein CpaF
LETRPENIEGAGAITQRDLVINALRMRPDRIIIGECRGPEALDMMQAMNTGHDGSMTTCARQHGASDAFSRLETMVMMASQNIPDYVIRQMLVSAVQIVVQCVRLTDGSRKVVSVCEVRGADDENVIMEDIFLFDRKGVNSKGGIEGTFRATGIKPLVLDRLKAYGVKIDPKIFEERQEVLG